MIDSRLLHQALRACRGVALGLALLVTGFAHAEDAPAKSIAILDFELIDDQEATVPDHTLGPRLSAISAQLREEFAAKGLYRVVDITPAAALIAKLKTTQEFRLCNGCEVEVAKALGTDRVLIGWVQKVSNLILNLNVQIEDGKTGEILLNKSVDLRGNTDLTWRRGVSYLVQSMVDKHQGGR